MPEKIVCFGDSNTFGYDPRSYFGGRLPKEVRWTGRLDSSELKVVNYGENGRQIPHTPWAFSEVKAIIEQQAPFAVFMIMLGTNDLLMLNPPCFETLTKRMAEFVLRVRQICQACQIQPQILLVSPPAVAVCENDADKRASDFSQHLGEYFEVLAKKLSVDFVDANKWQVPLAFDRVHFSESGHAIFAKALQKELAKIL